MDALDREIINRLQSGFPICDQPYAVVAGELGTSEHDLLTRLDRLLKERLLTRFGPMYHAERMGGGLSLAAMKIPAADFERVASVVNALPEVAHNYERAHTLNMWFVLATATPEEQQAGITQIEQASGYPVYNMPKIREYFVGLNLQL